MSYTNLLYHIVYATKERAPLIAKIPRPRLHEYLGGTVRGFGGVPIEINGVADHVHLLVRLRSIVSVSEFLSKLKSGSSGWAKRQTAGRFAWQARYGAFTVSQSRVQHVRNYIRNQEKHHQKMSFEEEFKILLRSLESSSTQIICGDSLCRQLRRLRCYRAGDPHAPLRDAWG